MILGLALADAAIIGWRADVVWAMQQTAPFYAAFGLPLKLPGIHVDRLTTAAERRDGEPVLIVKGEIGNSAAKPEPVRHLRLAIRNGEHQEIYSWTVAPARRSLAEGETIAFHSELTLPPTDTREVLVRFIDRENTF